MVRTVMGETEVDIRNIERTGSITMAIIELDDHLW